MPVAFENNKAKDRKIKWGIASSVVILLNRFSL